MYQLNLSMLLTCMLMFAYAVSSNGSDIALPNTGLSGDLMIAVSIKQPDGTSLNVNDEFMRQLVVTFPVISGGISGVPAKEQKRRKLWVGDDNQIVFNVESERKRVSQMAETLTNHFKLNGLATDPNTTKIARFGSFASHPNKPRSVVRTAFFDTQTEDLLMLMYFDQKSTFMGDDVKGKVTIKHDVYIPDKGFYWLRSKQLSSDEYLIERTENFQHVGLIIHYE